MTEAAAGVHQEREDNPWDINVADHPKRTESAGFSASKKAAHKILATLGDSYPFGPGPWQMHHGGSLWTNDGAGWFLVLASIGIEWSAQFACDPAKVNVLRLTAARHYLAFPKTVVALEDLGYHEAEVILREPIKDAAGIARWVDSIFNSCVPLAAGVHTGVLGRSNHVAGGAHHYPRPISDIQFVKRDDFELWVVDDFHYGSPLAVVPVAERGSGDGRVEVLYAHPTSQLHRLQHEANARGERLILPADHSAAEQAFKRQQ